MTARAFLVRGLLAGLVAGFAAFLVAQQVGEPPLERAIAYEETSAAGSSGSSGSSDDGHDHTHADDAGGGTVVSRSTQSTAGLLVGSLAVGTALGGLAGLVSAAVVGRIGRLTPGQSTALVCAVGLAAVSLVPFAKYPSTPPGLGQAETIGDRTAWYFAFLLVSLAVAALASVVAVRVHEQAGAYAAVVAGAGGYLLVVLVTGLLLPGADAVGSFPAETLWEFRWASLLTLLALWSALGVALVGLVGRLHRDTSAASARRALAASL